ISSLRESLIPNLASAAWSEPSGGLAVTGDAGVIGVVALTRVPHRGQKTLPAGTVGSHSVRDIPARSCCRDAPTGGEKIRGEPHWRQNFLPGGLASPHLLQFIC